MSIPEIVISSTKLTSSRLLLKHLCLLVSMFVGSATWLTENSSNRRLRDGLPDAADGMLIVGASDRSKSEMGKMLGITTHHGVNSQ